VTFQAMASWAAVVPARRGVYADYAGGYASGRVKSSRCSSQKTNLART